MENQVSKSKGQLLIPVLVGAAAAAALAYFLISDDTAELREELTGSLGKIWDDFKVKAMDTIANANSEIEPLAEKVV